METTTSPAEHPSWRLRMWLEASGHNKMWMAEQLGCSAKHVSNMCNGRAFWSTRMAVKLAAVTGIPANDWMRWRFEYEAATLGRDGHGPEE